MVLQLESRLKAVALHANRSWRVKRKGKPGVILKLGVRIAIKLPFSLSRMPGDTPLCDTLLSRSEFGLTKRCELAVASVHGKPYYASSQ